MTSTCLYFNRFRNHIVEMLGVTVLIALLLARAGYRSVGRLYDAVVDWCLSQPGVSARAPLLPLQREAEAEMRERCASVCEEVGKEEAGGTGGFVSGMTAVCAFHIRNLPLTGDRSA